MRLGLEEAIGQGKITHMNNYIKLPKTGLDDSQSLVPMPYELPCQQKESNPSVDETTDTVVNSSDTNELESEVPLSNSEMWEQFRRAMAKEVPTTLAARPCQSTNNKRSAGYKLQDEYLSG